MKVFPVWGFQNAGGDRGCRERGQRSFQLPGEDKGVFPVTGERQVIFTGAGNGCPSDDLFLLCRCQPDDQTVQAERKEKSDTNCRLADLVRAQEQCQTALRAPAWAKCASHVVLGPFLLNCTNSLCQGGRLSRALCESLETFGAACRAKGLNPPIWRNSSFCRECPLRSLQTLPHLVSVSVPLKVPVFLSPCS